MKLLALAVALLAPAAAQAQQQDWRKVAVTDVNALFIDANRIERDAKPYPRVWMLLVMPPEQEIAALSAHMEFNCATNAWHGLEAIGYGEENDEQTHVGANDEWVETKPMSNYRILADIACGRSQPRADGPYKTLPIAEGRALISGQ